MIMSEESGTHFDPEILGAFLARSEDMIKIQLDNVDAP